MKRTFTEFTVPNLQRFKEKLLYWAGSNEIFFALDSNAHKDAHSNFENAFAFGVADFLECERTQGAFEKLKIFQESQKDFLFGFLSYDLKNDTEDLDSKNEDFICLPKLFFFRPPKLIFIKNDKLIFQYLKKYELEVTKDFQSIQNYKIPAKPTAQPIHLKSKISQKQYLEKIHAIKKHLQKGDFYEMNFCFEFYEKGKKIEPLQTFLQLNTIAAMPFAAMVKFKDSYILCASPERFLKKEKQKIISQPIKGTSKRAADTKQDTFLKKTLLESEKERAENTMIVDLVRNDLSKIARKASVKVTEFCKIYSFKQVHQMISTVTCEANQPAVKVLKNTFPMGSMTGAPKLAAMQRIEALENTQRGVYSGSIGYFTPWGDFDFNVVIRSILYNAATRYISHMVGSAITINSDPQKEYEECLVKASTVQSLLSTLEK